MRDTTSQVIIVGRGLAGLVTAARLLHKRPDTVITLVGTGNGGSPDIAALNAPLPAPGAPCTDSPELQAADMLAAGYGLNDPALPGPMCAILPEGIAFLEALGVRFARDGASFKRRLASGSSCPRSLCDTGKLVGKQIVSCLEAFLHGKVRELSARCVALLRKPGGGMAGIMVHDGQGEPFPLWAPVVVAAWGGVGNLFPNSTYPGDVDGCGLAMAHAIGAPLVDLEFVEFEPLVTLVPVAAAGEPCPTAMLGEGAHLLNAAGERFLLRVRPQGEGGAPKSLINDAIAKEIEAGRGTPHGGVHVDLRHIPLEVLRGYPWFYERLLRHGHDVKTTLLEVAPAAHSHSGGLVVDADYATPVPGLFAVGEAAGGAHGACRMAGNAASQALASGLLAADRLAAGQLAPGETDAAPLPPCPARPQERADLLRAVQQLMGKTMGLYREGASLRETLAALRTLYAAATDTVAQQRILAAFLTTTAALARTESRGTHQRRDFPDSDSALYNLVLATGAGPLDARVTRRLR